MGQFMFGFLSFALNLDMIAFIQKSKRSSASADPKDNTENGPIDLNVPQ